MIVNIRKATDDEQLLYTINTDVIPREDDLVRINNLEDDSIEYAHVQAVRFNYVIIQWNNQILDSVDVFI